MLVKTPSGDSDATLKERLAEVEAELADMKQQLAQVSSEMKALRDHSDSHPRHHHDIGSILARFLPHHRKHHPTKEELCLAARLSLVTYYTCCTPGEPTHGCKVGLDVKTWNGLKSLPDGDAVRTALESALEECPNAIGYPASVARVVDSANAHRHHLVMIAHEESSEKTLDGQVSIWRSDDLRMIIIAWRGTDSLIDAKMDAKSAISARFTSKEEFLTPLSKSAKHLLHTVDDESISPLPHFYDKLHIRRRLLVGKGFLVQYLGERLNARVNAHVNAQLKAHPDASILVTGHSLGGALSSLATYELAQRHPRAQILNVSFGAPRHVNEEFTRVLARLPNVRCYRVANELDVVTRSRLNPSFKHLGHTIWLHHQRVSPPKPFGHVPLRLRFGGLDVLPLCLPELFCCITSGVGDHGMDHYVDHMDGIPTSYKWDKYERRTRKRLSVLEKQREGETRRENEIEVHFGKRFVGGAAAAKPTAGSDPQEGGGAPGPKLGPKVLTTSLTGGRMSVAGSPRAGASGPRSRRRSSVLADRHLEAITQRLSSAK